MDFDLPFLPKVGWWGIKALVNGQVEIKQIKVEKWYTPRFEVRLWGGVDVGWLWSGWCVDIMVLGGFSHRPLPVLYFRFHCSCSPSYASSFHFLFLFSSFLHSSFYPLFPFLFLWLFISFISLSFHLLVSIFLLSFPLFLQSLFSSFISILICTNFHFLFLPLFCSSFLSYFFSTIISS